MAAMSSGVRTKGETITPSTTRLSRSVSLSSLRKMTVVRLRRLRLIGFLDAFHDLQKGAFERALAALLAQRLDGAARGDPAPVHDRHLVAKPLDLAHDVRGEKHGQPLVA